MKKKITYLMIPATFLVAGCASDNKKEVPAPSRAALEVPTDTVDTTGVHNIPFEVRTFEKEKGENELEVEYPVSGNPELLDSVRYWMNEQLTATYRGPLDDPEAFFNHYASQLGEDPDLNEWGGFTKDDFKLGCVNDHIVTYLYSSYIYEGGAHGMGGTYGITFLQSDGSVFDKKCITSLNALHALFIQGLKEYFKVNTDAELKDCLLVESLAQLAPPGMNPWVEEGGVVFSYTPYEIAPYSAGSPRFTIPFSKIEPYLTPQGLRFFK